jgi:hypothetical protein
VTDAPMSVALEQFFDSRSQLTRVLLGGEQPTATGGAYRGPQGVTALSWLVTIQVVPQAAKERLVASVVEFNSLE